MAVGPFARILAQLVVPVVAVLARALPAAYAQALQNARKSGADAAVNQVLRRTMTKSEALQVLNLAEGEATVEAIQQVSELGDWQTQLSSWPPLSPVLAQQYDRYMAANDVSKGGSFYLQSKVYRAKEMLDQYQKEQDGDKAEEEAQSDEAKEEEKK